MKAATRILALGIAVVLMSTYAMAQGIMSPIQYWRSYDQSGVNVFETTKDSGAAFNGLGVRLGGGFTQGYQALSHENYLGEPGTELGNANDLYDLSAGFNNASANLFIDAQLARGVRLNLTLYLSSRHHTETWVKGGYIQFDDLSFLNAAFLDEIMKYLTIRVGHMEVNYGDAHFRRSDGGQSLYNPFVENYIVDAFTTEIGGDIAFQSSGILAVFGMTNGEIKGNIADLPDTVKDASPAIYAKLGYDNMFGDLRFRLTGSMYSQSKSPRNTLLQGDRTGSHYYGVTEKAGANLTSSAWSGRVNPNFSDHLTLFQFNLFLDYMIGNAGSVELFGTYEMGNGNNVEKTDAIDDRSFNQMAVDLIYRIGRSEDGFIGFRYNTVGVETGLRDDAGEYTKQTINRIAIGAGWFVLPYVLLKGEYVMQDYNDYAAKSQFDAMKFNGLVIEAVVGF